MKILKFGEWIPKSKPPNKDCFCLGYFKSDAVGYSVILFSQGAFWIKKEALDQLTHWMPLPMPPNRKTKIRKVNYEIL